MPLVYKPEEALKKVLIVLIKFLFRLVSYILIVVSDRFPFNYLKC